MIPKNKKIAMTCMEPCLHIRYEHGSGILCCAHESSNTGEDLKHK